MGLRDEPPRVWKGILARGRSEFLPKGSEPGIFEERGREKGRELGGTNEVEGGAGNVRGGEGHDDEGENELHDTIDDSWRHAQSELLAASVEHWLW